jgi:hypothetical protein
MSFHPFFFFFLFDEFKSTIRIMIGCTVKKLEVILVLEEKRKEKKTLPDLPNLIGWLSFPNWGFHPQTPAPIPSKSVLSSPNWGLCTQTPTPIHSKSVLSSNSV